MVDCLSLDTFRGTGPAASAISICFEGAIDPAFGVKLVEIAGKCPVHRTLETASADVTKFEATSTAVATNFVQERL